VAAGRIQVGADNKQVLRFAQDGKFFFLG